MPELDWTGMPIHQAFRTDWKTPELLLEGSLGCAKTTVGLDKEIDALLKYPGIPSLLFRWTEDAVSTKLKPAFEELLSIRNITATFDAKQKRYEFENGSVAYMFGLKAVSAVEMFNKIRGLGVCRIFGDQVEEMQQEVAGELRGRLRPDLTATMSGRKFPFQLTFVANPSDQDFWLSREFPEDNRIKGRKLYSLSVFDNRHLPKETVESLMRAWPEDHPKNRTMVLGKRGPRVYGVPVFEGLYRNDLHWRAIDIKKGQRILESIQCGKHNPAWVFAQALPAGGLVVLGAVLGLGMVLDDFLPLIEQCKRDWYPHGADVATCIAPMGGLSNILRERGRLKPVSHFDGNSPIVRVQAIENLSGYMRRRNVSGDEAFGVSNDEHRFLINEGKDGQRLSPIVHHAAGGGYTWDEEFKSSSNKEVRRPRDDDKFANIMHCVENIELNFLAGQKTPQELEDDQKRRDALSRPRAVQSQHGWMA